MAKRFSDMISMNTVFMFKYMVCYAQILNGVNCDSKATPDCQAILVLTRITDVFIQCLDD